MDLTGDAEGLVRGVLELARRESAEIIAAAEAEAEKILAGAAAAAQIAGRARAEAALAEAARRRAALLAAVPAETARLRLARREELLDSVRAAAWRRLAGESRGAGAAQALAALAAQAAGGMEGNSFVLTLAPDNAAALRGLAAETERLAGKGKLELEFEADPSMAGGVKVRDAGGRQFWDNSFKARLERLWPELRSCLFPPEGK